MISDGKRCEAGCAKKKILEQADTQGYITFDDIMECADADSLSIQDFDWLTSAISTRGIIIYDESPAKRTIYNQDDNYDDYAQIDYETVYNRIIKMDESLKGIVDNVRNIVPPQRREFSTLKYQVKEGNKHARERMIKMHLRIALKIALQRSVLYDMEIQDAVSEACLGLIRAVDKYDFDTKSAFTSYASMWILQNISRRQPTRRTTMYYPVHKKEMFYSVYPLLKKFGYFDNPDSQTYNKLMSILRQKLSLTDAEIEEAIQMSTPFDSIDELFSMYFEEHCDCFEFESEEDEYKEKIVPEELIHYDNVEQVFLKGMMKKKMEEMLSTTLTSREKTVIEMRYGLVDGEEKTLEEIGRMFITRERIRQIETKAMKKMKLYSNSHCLNDYID